MRALLQRTTGAERPRRRRGRRGDRRGLVVLLGVGPDDDEAVADALARRVDGAADLRRRGRPDEPVAARRRRRGARRVAVHALRGHAAGRRPGFTGAAAPELAERLYQRFAAALAELGVEVATGRFGAEMAVELVNDGPFTIWLDTAER